jgi:Flp pilus assembly protein TadD
VRDDEAVFLRVALVAVSAAVIFFLAVWFVDAQRFDEGKKQVLAARTQAQAAVALHTLQSSRTLNPSTQPLLAEGTLFFQTGRLRDAERVSREMVRKEPRNASGWAQLAFTLQKRGDPAAALALARLDQLNPLRNSVGR